jgi:hypothetical protein
MVNYGDLQFAERIMVARRSEMSAEWKVRFAICIASVAIQAFTKLLFSFSGVLKTTNCTFQESCHPKHCTKSFPYSQALRIKRICSNEQTTKKRLGELKCHLKKRGYNNASINHCFNKASGIDRKDLIQYKEKNANNIVPFVTHVEALPSHLKDTTYYLQKMESMNPLPSGTILVSMDLTSLYTNIPHNDGIEACREAWNQRAVKEPPMECLVQLLTLVLKHNNFTFNGEHFTKWSPKEGGSWIPFFEDNQWCLSNVRVTLLHEVKGGNRQILRFFLWGAHLLKQWVSRGC